MAYLTAADLRESRVLDRGDRFPDDLLEDLVAEFEATVETWLGVAFEPREATVSLPGTRMTRLVLPHVKVREVQSVGVDAAELSEGDIGDLVLWGETGMIERPAGWCASQVVVTYSHGEDETPAAVLRACREFVRAKATRGASNGPRNAAGPAGIDGTSYPVAQSTPTGVREADRIIATLPSYRTPGIA